MKKVKVLILSVLIIYAICGCGQTSGEKREAYVQPEMKGEISVNVYESSEWLETAAQLFEKKYPDMKVNIHVFYKGTDMAVTENGGTSSMSSRPAGQTREDYITQLNTQLLSGEADDIVITSVGLPLGRYVKMGVFENLSGYLQAAEEINESNYYMNIFDAYRMEDGALYQLPISATAVPLVCFDRELVEQTGIGPEADEAAVTWREALDMGEAIYDNAASENTFLPDARSIVGNLFTKAAVACVNYETDKVEPDRDKMKGLLAVFEEMEYFESIPEGFDYYNKECFIPYEVRYQPDVEVALSTVREEIITRQWKYDDGFVYLSPYYAFDFGIFSKSSNKELAWEFLRFLISEEVQTLPSCDNAGVNKMGLRARVEGYASMQNCSPEEIKEMVSLVDGWVSQITAYRAENTDLIQISEGVLNEFIVGSLTEEETIDTLINRLEQYMNE